MSMIRVLLYVWKNEIQIKSFLTFFFFYFLTHDWFNNHLKHLGRETRLGILIRPVWLWHHYHLVYQWQQGSNPQPFDCEPSSLQTRPQLWVRPRTKWDEPNEFKGFIFNFNFCQNLSEIIYRHFAFKCEIEISV